jgi:RNA polymerase-associated protein CTR9
LLVLPLIYIYFVESSSVFTEIDEYYAEVKYERIAILNALGAFYTFLGKVERAPQKEGHFKDATQYYNRASRIDETEPSTWIGKGSNIF